MLTVGYTAPVRRIPSAGLPPDVPIHGCLCFVMPAGTLADIGLPLARRLPAA
jgi:hypothetical protein